MASSNRTNYLFHSSYTLPNTLVSSTDDEPQEYATLEKMVDLPCSKNRKSVYIDSVYIADIFSY